MKKIKIYAKNIEQQALDQFNSAMEQDFSIQGALMADAHTGYSLPIGGVVSTEGVIVPSWVGYDIGCGMCALSTTFKIEDIKKNSKSIFNSIYKNIPTGFNVNKNPTDTKLNPNSLTDTGREAFEDRKGFRALGSLGGGNHFIEIGQDENSNIWIVIHSGSRGVGHGIATKYIRIASRTGKVKEGHYPLYTNQDDGRSYINDMNWCLEFALENRKEMMRRAVETIAETCEGEANWSCLINRHHNHAELRDGLWIHRKGATHADKGMMGVIPGNMRDGSFIVKGKGNPDSLYSSSHGAGRVLGRNKARKELSKISFIKHMKGITAKVEDSTIDESPEAYKNIFEVMRLQKDLVEIISHIKPLINIKA